MSKLTGTRWSGGRSLRKEGSRKGAKTPRKVLAVVSLGDLGRELPLIPVCDDFG